MKQYLMITAATLFGVSAAHAQTLTDADTDLNGTVSLEEAQAVDPSVTETDFAVYDINGDGELSPMEYAAWNEDRAGVRAGNSDSGTTAEGEITMQPVVDPDINDGSAAGDDDDSVPAEPDNAVDVGGELDIDGDVDLTPVPLTRDLEADPEPVIEPDLSTDVDPAAEAEAEAEAEVTAGDESDGDPQ